MIHESPPWLKGFIGCLRPLSDEKNPSKTRKKEVHRDTRDKVALISGNPDNPAPRDATVWIELQLWSRRSIGPEKTVAQMTKVIIDKENGWRLCVLKHQHRD